MSETRWRNPFPDLQTILGTGEACARFVRSRWSCAPDYVMRLRAGARHACARLRRERDEARERAEELEELLRQSENHAAEEYARGYLVAGWRNSVTTDTPTVRGACRRRMPLDGADAQCLEHALTITERERDTARRDLAETREALAEARRHAETMREAAHIASEAGRIGAEQVATARAELAALEWLATRGYPVARLGDRYSAKHEAPWHDSWAECAAAEGWEG